MSVSPANYSRLVTLAGSAAILTAVLLITGKTIAWFMTGSSSLLASLTDSLMDVSASVINLFAIRYATAPADDDHHFGHGKAESLAGLAQAAFISGSAMLLLMNGVSSLLHPQPLAQIEAGLWVSGGSIVLTLLLVTLQAWVIRQTGSVAIKADSLHYRSDLLLNSAVLAALVLSQYGWYWADGLFAIAIGCLLLKGAIEIGYESIQVLLDKQLPDEEQDQIVQLSQTISGVRGVHDLRTRHSGPTRFIQLHLELEDNLPLLEAHQISDLVEAELLKAFPHSDIIIHLDPVSAVSQEVHRRPGVEKKIEPNLAS